MANKASQSSLVDIGGASVLAQLQTNAFCDVKIYGKSLANGENAAISGHKIILAAASPHFREAFVSEGLIDSGGTTYTIEQIDHASLKIAVNYIYTSKLSCDGVGNDEIARIDQLKEVIIAADYLLMPQLVHLCGTCLTDAPEYLNNSSSVRIWSFARKYHCEVLATAALGYMLKDLTAATENVDFLNLTDEYVIALIKLLKSESASPDTICKAATNWLCFGAKKRQVYCESVMREVPLKALSVEGTQAAIESNCFSPDFRFKLKQFKELRAEIINLESRKTSTQNEMQKFQGYYTERTELIERLHRDLVNQVSLTEMMEAILEKYYSSSYTAGYKWVKDEFVYRTKTRQEARELCENVEKLRTSGVFCTETTQHQQQHEVTIVKADESKDSSDDAKLNWYENIDPINEISVLKQLRCNESFDIELYGKPLPEEKAEDLLPIKAHKMILATASSFLYQELQSNETCTYTVESVDHKSLKVVVDYIYSHELPFTDAEDAEVGFVQNVLMASDHLRMPGLIEKCGECLVSKQSYLNCSTSVNVWLFARKYHCNVLATEALAAMLKDFSAVADHLDFHNLVVEDALEVIRFMAINSQGAASADMTCKAALNWLGFADEERKALRISVMREVPMQRMSVEGLQAAMENELLSPELLLTLKQIEELRAQATELDTEVVSMQISLQALRAETDARGKFFSKLKGVLCSQLHYAERMEEFMIHNTPTHNTTFSERWIKDGKLERATQRQEAKRATVMRLYSGRSCKGYCRGYECGVCRI